MRISLRIFIPESQLLEQTLQAVLVGAPSEDGPQIAFVNVLDFLLHHHGNNQHIRSTKEQREREGNYPEKVIATVAANLLNSGSQMIKHLKCRKRRTWKLTQRIDIYIDGAIVRLSTNRLVHFIHEVLDGLAVLLNVQEPDKELDSAALIKGGESRLVLRLPIDWKEGRKKERNFTCTKTVKRITARVVVTNICLGLMTEGRSISTKEKLTAPRSPP